MKLTYRGVEYDYNSPNLEVTESSILGKYRGRPHPVNYVRHVPFPQPVADLKYRGIAYQTNRAGEVKQLNQQPHSIFTALRNRLNALNPIAAERHKLIREAARVHHESIRRSLEHRIEVARAQGNMGLLEQLEDEMRQMA